jgi:hypothetical protein
MKKCLNAFSKQIVGVVLRGISRQFKSVCAIKDEKLMNERVLCGNAEYEAQSKCMDEYVTAMNLGAANSEKINDMGFICCLFHQFHSCFVGALKKSPICTNNQIEFFNKLLYGTASDFLDLSCGPFGPKSTVCSSITSVLAKMTPKPAPYKAISVLPSMVDIVRNMWGTGDQPHCFPTNKRKPWISFGIQIWFQFECVRFARLFVIHGFLTCLGRQLLRNERKKQRKWNF